MKRSIWTFILLGLALLIVIAGIRQILKSRAELPKSITELQEEQGVPVKIDRAQKGTFVLSRSYLGTVEGSFQGDAVAAIMDKIVEIPVKVGDRVQKGQVVARLDTKSASARYSQLKLAYEDAEREAQRMENLYHAGAISEQMLEKAQLARDVARQNLESSSEMVSLTAPIDGVVTDLLYRVGETTESGKSVVRVADLKKVRVKFKVNHDDHRLISSNTPVYIKISGNGIREVPAKVSEIGLSADPDSRLFNVWITADNPDPLRGGLQPGLLVDVRAEVVRKPESLLLPRDAVLKRQERTGVFVVDDDRRAAFTPLQIGLENADIVEVLSGLQPGQTVVVYGQNNLNDGDLVKIVES